MLVDSLEISGVGESYHYTGDQLISAVKGATPAVLADPFSIVAPTNAVMTAALTPSFQRVAPVGSIYPLAQLGVRISTLFAANTVGIAVYQINWIDATHWTATLAAQLNAASSTAVAGFVKGDVTAGAAGAGAAVVPLDLARNDYIIGSMCSDITTAAFNGMTTTTTMLGFGYLRWTAAARSSTTDWPASFNEASSASVSASPPRVNTHYLYSPTGKILP